MENMKDVGFVYPSVAKFTRIRPKHPERATKTAVAVNGFSREKWINYAENNADIWIGFSSQFEGCVPVCHNPAFDRAFITIAAAEVGVMSLGVDHHWIGRFCKIKCVNGLSLKSSNSLYR